MKQAVVWTQGPKVGHDSESIITSGCENVIKAPSMNSMTHHQSFLEDYESSYFLCDLFFICCILMWFDFCCKIRSYYLQQIPEF